MAFMGTRFKVVGSSDYPVCDCCGKTNLTRAVRLENEDHDEYNVGVICASKLLAQKYQGNKIPVSVDAIIAMGRMAKTGNIQYLEVK